MGVTLDPLVLLWLSQTRTESLATLASPRRRKGGPGEPALAAARKRGLPEDSSPEVSSSSVAPPKVRAQGSGVSPVPSLTSSDIAEVDLEFWDLDINNESTNSTCSGNTAKITGDVRCFHES